MSKYTGEPIGEPRVIRDFLPSPDELAFRDEDAKIAIALAGVARIGDGTATWLNSHIEDSCGFPETLRSSSSHHGTEAGWPLGRPVCFLEGELVTPGVSMTPAWPALLALDPCLCRPA